MAKITKVTKIYLISDQVDKDGNKVEYKKVFKILWELQKQVRELKNVGVQLLWDWHGFSGDYKKKYGVFPKDKDILSYTVRGFIYNKIKSDYDLYSGNVSQSLQCVERNFNSDLKDIKSGKKSVRCYKRDQPIDLHNGAIKLYKDKNDFKIDLSLLNRTSKKKYNFKNTEFSFIAQVNDKSTRAILERCIDGIYKICGSKLTWDKKENMWRLNLAYKFETDNSNKYNLDKDNILGVDLGIHMPICASMYGSLKRFTTNCDEITRFKKKINARKTSLQKQAKECGEGRIGHGRNTRMKPVYNIGDRIARFRDTKNHIYARNLINYAIKNNCGTIQIEDLTDYSKSKTGFLKEWSYYDLQTKIKNKAKEVGIEVVKINPKYTSQRCSKCGYIHKDNRPTQAKFKCLNCGFEENADYNASQNIAIRDIDKIIQCEIENNDL